jgi:hypothetical protein
MEPISKEWTQSWAAERGFRVSADGPMRLSYESTSRGKRATLLIDSERTPSDLVLLANRIVRVESEDEDDQLSDEDQVYLFWISESNIWDEMTEALASCAFAALTNTTGALLDGRGFLLQPAESQIAVLLCLNAILFGWDVYVAPRSGSFLCHISHDQYIDLCTRDPQALEMTLKRFEAWGVEFRSIDEDGK